MSPLFLPSSNNSTPRKQRFSSAPVTPSSSNSTPRKRPWSVGHVPSSPSSRDSTPKTRWRTASFEGSPRESSRRWYGPETRKACLRGAENRRPPVPDQCKRGHSGGIRLQMCYAMRSAGLFLGYVCRSHNLPNSFLMLLLFVFCSVTNAPREVSSSTYLVKSRLRRGMPRRSKKSVPQRSARR